MVTRTGSLSDGLAVESRRETRVIYLTESHFKQENADKKGRLVNRFLSLPRCGLGRIPAQVY